MSMSLTSNEFTLGTTEVAPQARKLAGEAPLNVFLGSGCIVNGALELDGPSQIDGSVKGELHSKSSLVIGKEALIEAQVMGSQVRVFGSVRGNIQCSERLELMAGSDIEGEISSPAVVIHDGARFEGRCTMLRSECN